MRVCLCLLSSVPWESSGQVGFIPEFRDPWGKRGRDRAGSGSQAKWLRAGPVSPLAKDCMSAWAEEGELCPSKTLSVLASHTGQALPPELPAFLLGLQPSAQDA